MENLDLTALVRMGLILAHLLAFAAAFAAVAFGDFAIFRRRRVDTELLGKAAKGVMVALTALWVTGLAVIWLDTRFDLGILWARPKLLAKFSIAGLLTLNGMALHRWAFPRFSQPQDDPQRAAVLPAVLGAISATTWAFAAFVGVGKAVTPVLGYSGFMALYAASVVMGIAVSLTYIRPRLVSVIGQIDGPLIEMGDGRDNAADRRVSGRRSEARLAGWRGWLMRMARRNKNATGDEAIGVMRGRVRTACRRGMCPCPNAAWSRKGGRVGAVGATIHRRGSDVYGGGLALRRARARCR
jgi:hypothetical protein